MIGNERWQFARVATNPMTSCALHEYFYGFFQMRSIILNATFYLGMPPPSLRIRNITNSFRTMSIESLVAPKLKDLCFYCSLNEKDAT